MRTNLPRAAGQASMSISRGTVRDFEDDHLVQEIKEVDVFHSETHSNKGAPLERFQMVGMTAVPLKQQEEEGGAQAGQQAANGGSSGSAGGAGGANDGFNHKQPKGPAAEAMILYLNGSRSHPVAMCDDRRVRPYGMSEGEGAHYAPDGSEQMCLFKDNGTYLISLDGTSIKDKKSKKERFVSMRHVEKDMQTHKIEKKQNGAGQQAAQEKYKHEGKKVNTEIRCTKDRIEFRAGDKVVGYYEVSSDTWFHTSKTMKQVATDTHSVEATNSATRKANQISDAGSRIDHDEA